MTAKIDGGNFVNKLPKVKVDRFFLCHNRNVIEIKTSIEENREPKQKRKCCKNNNHLLNNFTE